MPEYIIYGVVLSVAAFFFYTAGVWAEVISGKLQLWHVVAFFFGVVSNVVAAWFMAEYVGELRINVHSIIGILGLMMMIMHFFWAVGVLARCYTTRRGVEAEKALYSFHKYSIAVWLFWMGAFISGVILGVQML